MTASTGAARATAPAAPAPGSGTHHTSRHTASELTANTSRTPSAGLVAAGGEDEAAAPGRQLAHVGARRAGDDFPHERGAFRGALLGPVDDPGRGHAHRPDLAAIAPPELAAGAGGARGEEGVRAHREEAIRLRAPR